MFRKYATIQDPCGLHLPFTGGDLPKKGRIEKIVPSHRPRVDLTSTVPHNDMTDFPFFAPLARQSKSTLGPWLTLSNSHPPLAALDSTLLNDPSVCSSFRQYLLLFFNVYLKTSEYLYLHTPGDVWNALQRAGNA